MKLAAFLGITLIASQATALELGAGISYFAESSEASPCIGISIPVNETAEAQAIWASDERAEHVLASYSYPVYTIENVVLLSVSAGGGFFWQDFDKWEPELTYAIVASGEVAKMVARAGWHRLETGGEYDGESLYFAALYLKR